MSTWTSEEEARLAPYVLRRADPYRLSLVAASLGRRLREVRRHRRWLRRHLRRASGLAARPGRLAA